MTHYDHNMTPYYKKATHFDYTILRPNPKSLTEGKNRLWHKVDSGIGLRSTLMELPMVNVLESTLASTYGEVIVNYGIGSHPILQVFLWIRPQHAHAQ
jgi:hypothetical protein